MALPNDLVSLPEAAKMIERSPRTIRRWITDGRLARYEGQPPEHGGSAPALVSTSDLLAQVADKKQQPRVDRPGHGVDTGGSQTGGEVDTHAPDVSIRPVDLRLVELEAQVRQTELTGRVQLLEAQLEASLDQADAYREMLIELRRDRDDWRERHDATRAELTALRALMMNREGLPWWRRLLGGPTPELPDPAWSELPEAK